MPNVYYIPKTNTGMLEILGPYTKDRGGYGALYVIMRRTCSFMEPATQGWGPGWSRTTSPSKYATELQTWVSEYEMRHKLDIHRTTSVTKNSVSGPTIIQYINNSN
jgi:hypothetical protein